MILLSVRLIYVVAFLCFAGAVLDTAQAQQPAPAQNTGSISGRVTADGKPKAGLVVELLTTDRIGPRRVIAKATTNKTGKYILRNVGSGTYDVSFSSQTLILPNQGESGQSGKTVTIEAGERIKGIDFDLVSQGSIRGRVRDAIGEPVKGQRVELILRGEDNYSHPFFSSVPGEQSTNDDGVYYISSVPPGRYIVKVGAAYGLTSHGPTKAGHLNYVETFHPDASEESKATVVEIAAGRETTDVDINVGNPLKVYEIVGQTIVFETGTPVPNVGLAIVTTGKNTTTSVHGAFSSDANGEFRIQNALPGHYVVSSENDRKSNTYGDPVSFDVRDADITGLKIPMHSASTITGIVTVEGSVDADVADILSKMIISAHTWSDDLMSSMTSAPINAAGGFQIAGIRPGKVNLSSHVHPGGPEGVSLIRIERNGVELRDGIEVRAGEDVKGLRLVLGVGNSVLRGDVKIEGEPLEGVNLYVMYRATNGNPKIKSFSRVKLDARRHFIIKALMPGEYELTMGPMSVEVSGERGYQTMRRMPTVKETIVVAPGADAEVTLVITLKPLPPAPPQP